MCRAKREEGPFTPNEAAGQGQASGRPEWRRSQLLQNQKRGPSLSSKIWAKPFRHSSEAAWGNEFIAGSSPGLSSPRLECIQDAAWFPALGIPAHTHPQNAPWQGSLAHRPTQGQLYSSMKSFGFPRERAVPRPSDRCTSCLGDPEYAFWRRPGIHPFPGLHSRMPPT